MRPFFGVMLSVERVVMPNAVQIYNIAGLSEELITLYLENPRTHAGEVASVKLDEEEGYVVVTFENRSGMSVLSESQLIIFYYNLRYFLNFLVYFLYTL